MRQLMPCVLLFMLFPREGSAQITPFHDKWGKVAGYTVTSGVTTVAYGKDDARWASAVTRRDGRTSIYDAKGRPWRPLHPQEAQR